MLFLPAGYFADWILRIAALCSGSRQLRPGSRYTHAETPHTSSMMSSIDMHFRTFLSSDTRGGSHARHARCRGVGLRRCRAPCTGVLV